MSAARNCEQAAPRRTGRRARTASPPLPRTAPRSHETQRGNTITTTTNTSGDTTNRNTTVTSSSGETASGSRTTERSGDKVKTESDWRSSSGASYEGKAEAEFDNGSLEKVKWEGEGENRYGYEQERKLEAERKDGYWEYEREFKDSDGRDAKVEGEAWRGPGGQINRVGELDTKYWGDYDFANTRGRYGSASAVYGPYGGFIYTGVPAGGSRYTIYGRSYYSYGWYSYHPYYWRSALYYYPWYPPYGYHYWGLPTGCVTINISGGTYYTHDSVYYQETVKEGKVAYEVVPAPSGATVKKLPTGYATFSVGDQQYYYYRNTFYRRVQQNDEWVFVVIEMPTGMTTVEKLPADFEPIPVSEVTFFKSGEEFYLPYLNKEQEVYLVVDEPPAPPVTEQGGQASSSGDSTPLAATFAIPEGTRIRVRIAGQLDSGENTTGDHYMAYLDSDLKVGAAVVALRGSRVYGRLVEVEGAGSPSGRARLKLELTDILINGQVVPISTASYTVDGKSAATTPGQQVKVPAQTLIDFTLDRPFTVKGSSEAAD